jgi:hypothetical protein
MSRSVILSLLPILILLSGCVESTFTLDPDSRLPKWFSVPPGYSRADLKVQLDYYNSALSSDDAFFKLVNNKGKVMSEVSGKMCWHPVTAKKRNQFGGFEPDSYPHYAYFQIHGITEVIEHSHSPVFKIIDDPVLLNEAVKAGQCKSDKSNSSF